MKNEPTHWRPAESEGGAFRAAETLSRRGFLAAGMGLLAARSAAAVPPARTTPSFATLVNLAGGNDALNTLVPTRLASYATVRPQLALAPEQGASLDEGPYRTLDYVLHPALQTVAELYRQGQAAIVRLVGFPGVNASHSSCEAVWSRGAVTPLTPDSGWIARYKDRNAPSATGVVALGLQGRLDFFGAQTPVTYTLASERNGGLSTGDAMFPANDQHRHAVVRGRVRDARPDPRLERACTAVRAAYAQEDLLRGNGPPPPVRPPYPETSFGFILERGALLLHREELDTRIFYARTNDVAFDTHAGQGSVQGAHAGALRTVDDALAAYVQELRGLGMWNDAVVVLFSEFGRRTRTTFDGTDHGDGGVVLVLGGAVRGGLYGPELREEHLQAVNLPSEVDFRSIWAELVANHLRADPGAVFPTPYVHTPLGLFG